MGFPEATLLSREQVISQSSTQAIPLGARGVMVDGRVYRYAKAGATDLLKGLLCQGVAGTNRWGDATYSYISTQWVAMDGTTVCSDTEISTTYAWMPLTSTKDSGLTVAEDYFKEGFMWIKSSSTESGQMVKIKSHSASSSGESATAASGAIFKVYFEDDERLSEVIDTDSVVAMQKNPYDGIVVIPAESAKTSILLGVPNRNISASKYFWLQTWGPCPVRQDTYLAESGDAVWGAGTTYAGHVRARMAHPEVQVGTMMGLPQLAYEFILVHLTISP